MYISLGPPGRAVYGLQLAQAIFNLPWANRRVLISTPLSFCCQAAKSMGNISIVYGLAGPAHISPGKDPKKKSPPSSRNPKLVAESCDASSTVEDEQGLSIGMYICYQTFLDWADFILAEELVLLCLHPQKTCWFCPVHLSGRSSGTSSLPSFQKSVSLNL